MRKRLLSALLSLCMVLTMLPVYAFAVEENADTAVSGSISDDVNWSFDADTKTLTVSGTGNIALPDIYGNTHPWDGFKSDIENLVIGDGITGTATTKVFADLPKLQSIKFSNTFKQIGTGTFATDTSLRTVVLPDTIESFGSVAFSWCTSLQTMIVQNRTMSAPKNECWSSNQRKAPDGLIVYGYKWKSDDNKNDDNLTDFYQYVQWQNENNNGTIQFVAYDDTDAKGGLIKSAATSKSEIYWAFNDSTNTLTITGTGDINWDTETYINGNQPPWSKYQKAIENLVIGEGVTGTSQIKVFADLTKLKNIQFSSTFTKLATGTFATCTRLESVTLPKQIVSMGDVVFSNCVNLKSLVVNNRALQTPIKGNWSTGQNSSEPINKLPTNLTVYGYRYTDDTKETETTLYQYVQWQNTGRPEGDTQHITFNALDDNELTNGVIAGSDGILWNFDKDTKTLSISGKGSVTWDSNLYENGNNPPWKAFRSQIETVTIGDGITGSAVTKLFADLYTLKKINFPDSFTNLGNGTFATASSLMSVVLPDTITTMGSVVFSRCNAMTSLVVNNRNLSVPTESDWSSSNNAPPQDLTVYGYKWKSDDNKTDDNLTDIYKYVQYNNQKFSSTIKFVAWDDADNSTPIDGTGISWRYDSTSKTLYITGAGQIKWDDTKYSKGDNPPWSQYLSEIENLEIGEGITGTASIKVFSSLTKLKNVSFPSTFTTLGGGAFATCSSLEHIVLPESITTMGSVVFSRCNAMTTLVVENRNLSMGSSIKSEWSSDKTLPQNLKVYGYKWKSDDNKTEDNLTDIYKYVQYNNEQYSGKIEFVAMDDDQAVDGRIGKSDTYWHYDADTATLTITGTGMIPKGSSSQYPWQVYVNQINNLVIEDGVTGTEDSKALAELYALKNITFGKNFAILGAGAFANIQTLTRVTLPETITNIGSFAFSNCLGMTELRVENRNIKVADIDSYWNASDTQKLPENLTVYGYRYTTKGGSEETELYKYITNEKNKGITFVDLDVEADQLGDIRWSYDSSAKKLTISGKGEIPAVSEGQLWKRDASEIEEIEIKKGVTGIADNAFTGLPQLKTVTINRTVKTIAENAFDMTSDFTIKAKRNSVAKTFAEKQSNIRFEEDVTANILFIGNSYTEDAREYLRYVFNQYKFPADIHFGHLFSGGKTLAYYANTARQETNYSDAYGKAELDTESPRSQESSDAGVTYTNSLYYYTWDNNQTTFSSQGVKSIAYAMNDQDWDIVVIQGHDIEQAYENQYNKNFATNLEYLTNYIKSFDPTVDIGWYMTWRRNSESFGRLEAYWNTMKNIVEKNNNVSFIVPVGTAAENARGTYINDFKYVPISQDNVKKVDLLTGASINSSITPDNNHGIQRDETHMSAVVGRFLAGYTMGETLVARINSLGGAQFTNKASIEQIYSYDPNIGRLPAEYVQTIKVCADAAMESPYKVTNLDDQKTDPVEKVKKAVESADFTKAEWSEAGIQATAENILKMSAYADAKVKSVTVSDSTATIELRYGYSTATAEITYTPDAVVSSWTTYISSTKLGDTAVPGSDMKYSEVPAIQTALAKGYSDIWAAASQEDADKALAASKANLLSVVKEYVQYLADTVYNGGKPTELNGKTYSVSEADYKAAVSGITDASEISDVLSAYDTMLSKQTAKTITAIVITPDKTDLTGGGTVELTVSGVPSEGKLAVTCDNDIKVSEKDGKYTAELPNETQKYTFTASYTGTDVYTDASDTCIVNVTRKSSSSHSSSSSSTTNTVSASKANNGSVSLDKSSAKKGDTVTITVTPKNGYKLDKLTVIDAKGNTITVTNKGDNKYSFTMPDGKVTITPTFVAEQTSTEQPSDTKSFSDVSSSDWYNDAVKYVVDKGMMNGVGNNKFAPNDSTTRGMLMTVIARYAGQDTTGSNPWYQKGMEWAKSAGVSDGTAPNANITREQLVTMLYRYAKSAGKDVSVGEDTNILSYADATTVSEYAIPAMQWACGAGIVNGSNGKLLPKNNATRAEVAAILMRFCENVK